MLHQHSSKTPRGSRSRRATDRLRGYPPLVKVAYSPAKALAAKLRKQKQRRLKDNASVISEIETNHEELVNALEYYCSGEVDCAGIPEMIDAVAAIRSNRPGWMDDPKVREAILTHAAIARWLVEWKPPPEK